MTSNQLLLENLAKTDPIMSKLIKHIGPIELKPRRLPPFQSIIHAIIHQQLSGHVAAAIYDRFVSLFEKGKFPTPKQIKEIDFEIMRGAGLSKSKTIYIKEVAKMALMGIVPSLKECDKLSDSELKDRLLKIKGVGPWTVEMLLIFNFGRLDILPIHDLGASQYFLDTQDRNSYSSDMDKRCSI
jgi:3-methyladenine DNA glycosylase/8-oxoguanine DNA glycosylase